MTVDNAEVDILNKRIGAEYITLDGHRIFRLVWSESIFENRYGTFREFTESGLFIREVTEIRRVRKYNYIHNRWIFEMWAPGNMVANRETPDAINGDYVPVYVFENGQGCYLPPNEKVIRFLIAALHGRIKRDEVPSREYLEERQVQLDIDAMDDHPAWFQTRPGIARNAIWYSGGVPEWTTRRATFEPKDVRTVEDKAIFEAKAKRQAEERAREERIEAAREMVAETLAQKIIQKEKLKVDPQSPMHKGRA